MRPLLPKELANIRVLTEKSIGATLIEPTAMGLAKSIMDATGTVRAYLKEHGIHDFGSQKQGQDHKVLVPSFLITPQGETTSMASLYRPNTKQGDPRIWFKGLPRHANPSDILAIVAHENRLYVLNITQLDLGYLVETAGPNGVSDFVSRVSLKMGAAASELLAKLNGIARMGPIPALLRADTAIGRTLESLLGIDINSSRKPDFKGIELKSFRDKRGNRKNLFAQVPDWDISRFRSSAEILNAFGYHRGQEFKLYCTVSTKSANSQGLMLRIEHEVMRLVENSSRADIGDFVSWRLDTLHRRLQEKHSETFWIATDTVDIGGIEHFLYKKVEHTMKPILSQFDILLGQGIITVDHLIKRKGNGGVVEKGPLFKILPNSLGLLFPPSRTYKLID
jgi:hypothetical protein